MIICPKCSKENQDHYKFCLGCGAELPRDAAPKPFSPKTPPQGQRAVAIQHAPSAVPVPRPSAPMVSSHAPSRAAAPAEAKYGPPPPVVAHPVPPPPVAAAPVPPLPPPPPPPLVPPPAPSAPAVAPSAAGAGAPCPQCGHLNAGANLFCGSCGARLGAVGPSLPKPPPAAPTPAVSSLVLTALRADGTEAGTFAVPSTPTTLGRETGGIFAGDSYLSPRHATFRVVGPGRATVKDEGSLNGVYRRLARDTPTELKPNDVFRIGQEIIRFEPLVSLPPSADGVERLGSPAQGYVGRIALVIGRDETGNAFPVTDAGIHIGRERGDILFPEDGYVSGLHCRIASERGRVLLTDLGSSNGTFVRLREETELRAGDILLMGQQLFRVAL